MPLQLTPLTDETLDQCKTVIAETLTDKNKDKLPQYQDIATHLCRIHNNARNCPITCSNYSGWGINAPRSTSNGF